MKKISSTVVILAALFVYPQPSTAQPNFETPNASEKILLRTEQTDSFGRTNREYFQLSRFDWICRHVTGEPPGAVDVNDDLAPCLMLQSARVIEWQLAKADLSCRAAGTVIREDSSYRETLQLSEACQCTVLQEKVLSREVAGLTQHAVPFYFCLPFFKEEAAEAAHALKVLARYK